MDLTDTFSALYPDYFKNQSDSLDSGSPDWRDFETVLRSSSSENVKAAEDFDYTILLESLLNSNFNGNASNVNCCKANVSNGDTGSYVKNSSDRLSYNNFDPSGNDARKPSNARVPSKDIKWSDFESSFLIRSLSRQYAKTKTGNKAVSPSQSLNDWSLKSYIISKPNGTNHVPKKKLSNGNLTTRSNLSNTSNGFRRKTNGGTNSELSRNSENGYDTRLNSSRSSDKSTNRTRLANSAAPVNSHTVNNSLVNGLSYSGLGANGLWNNNLIGPQIMNGTNGFNRICGGLGNIGNLSNLGGLNPNCLNTNAMGQNSNAQLLRNHLINNQLLNTQLLNNQLLNPQILANQKLLNGTHLGNTFRAPAYNGDYVVNGQLLASNNCVYGNFMGSSDCWNNNFTCHHKNSHWNFCDCPEYLFSKPLVKPQHNYKNSKSKPIRKKRTKPELFPLASLKNADFERAFEYLKQTLLSLYRDQIVPIYFNVRGRFIEFNVYQIPPEHIMDICKRRPEVFNVVSNGALNETFIYLVEEPEWFNEWIDRNDLTDAYTPEMWEQFFDFIKNYKDDEGNEHFPGSIYGMSRVMQKLKLPFLEGMSLGTICHIVQLAIRMKRFLVYDMKTLKPSEIVKNNKFYEVSQDSQISETNETASTSEETIAPDVDENAVSGENTELKI